MSDQPPSNPSEHVSEQGPFPFPVPAPSPPVQRERDLLGNEPPGDLIDWSHRKGEPRVFALLWMIFLLTTTALMFTRLASGYTVSPSVSRPAAQQMLVISVLGMCVLWPLVRFSQRIARPSIVAASLRDMIVILIPLQAILWPQRLIVLGGWSTEVVVALVLHTTAWALILAGTIAIGSILIASSGASQRTRALAMLATLIVISIGPLIEMITLKGAAIGPSHANLGWMLSPVTGILEITADRSVTGQPAMVYNAHFRIITAVGCVGLALLAFGRALENTHWVVNRRLNP